MSGISDFHDITVTLHAEDKGKRLDIALSACTPLSRRRIRTAIDDGGVYVNKRRCRKAGLQIKGDERIRIVILENETLIPFCAEQILWRQNDLLLINKRSGQYAQEALHRSRGTLPAEIAASLGLSGDAARKLRPVHRLDRDTSGLMLLSSAPEQLNHLQAQWHDCVEKTYLAVVEPVPTWETRRIKHSIGKRRNRHGCYRVDAAGRACDTAAEVLERRGNRALLRLTPHTGRTHQLRVHLAAEGCPILGDARYQGKPHARMMLHAYRLCVQPPALT
ncbi:MAG: RluA family pseudouridine synthase, partial [Mariprofundaceae bacterium]|nr:RluA family pseudouridine synthase [Mariprofundaceae bacterium]